MEKTRIRDKHPGSARLPATHRKTGKERQFTDWRVGGGVGGGAMTARKPGPP
jgi:hypothetical protein